jgi:hypothetical protein
MSEFVSSGKKKSATSFPLTPTSGGGGGGGTIDPATLTYLNTNTQQAGTYVNPTTITFASGWISAPTGLPTTSISNFSIFCNGTLIENTAIVSFTVNGANNLTTLVINSTQLGYSFNTQDEVIAIGKFNS